MSYHSLTPQFILDRYANGQSSGTLDAVCLFIDLSGFTPLTIALMAYGTEGAEVLARVLAGVFEPLIDSVYEHGGFTAGFAGDAFKAIFPIQTENERDRKDTYLHALAAAWEIRQHLTENPHQTTRFGDFRFTGKVCAAAGEVEWQIWRDVENSERSQTAAALFGGEALRACMSIDPDASAGEIVIAESVRKALPESLMHVIPVGAHFRVDQLDVPRSVTLSPERTDSPVSDRRTVTATAFYPAWLLTSRIQGEFRQVVTVFINFERHFTDAESTRFQSVLFQLIDQYDGFLGRIGQIGDKDNGNTLLLFWGAPTGSERDANRALRFLLDLRESSPVRLRAGVTTHMAFAGFVGSIRAEEYTCHGSYVNLAARHLLAAGWDEIWLDTESRRQAGNQFLTTHLGDYRFKGFFEPQPVHLLKGRQVDDPGAFYTGEFVGRRSELDRLHKQIEPIFNGSFAGLITIEAEAGLGKSRLVHEFERETAALTSPPCWFRCQTDEILRQSLNPFRYWLHRYFGLKSDASHAANLAAFDVALERICTSTPDAIVAHELRRVRSFLAALVDLHWENSLYAQLEPQLRLENMLDALKMLIKAESMVQPVILLLEDAHWLDEHSRRFIEQLARNVEVYPFAIIAAQRPEPELPALVADETRQATLQLTNLDQEQVAAFIADLLKGPASPSLVALVVSRANGNPFFIEQLVMLLTEEGALEEGEVGSQLNTEKALTADSLPNNVRALLTARLDRLPTVVREVVQTASVLGREFDRNVLAKMLASDAELEHCLAQAGRARVWSAMDEARYLFRHALLRDSAYEMQLRSRRRYLHLRAANAVRVTYDGDPTPHYAEMVHHYHFGEAREDERTYAILAGDHAAGEFANDDALRFYSRSLALTESDDRHGQRSLLLRREAVLDLLGARDQQEQDLNALTQLEDDASLEERVTLLLRQTEHQRITGDYEGAQRTVAIALQMADEGDDIQQKVRCLHLQGRVLWPMGQYATARATLQKAHRIAVDNGLQKYVILCNYDIGVTYQQENRYKAARPYFGNAQIGFEATNDRMGLARCTAMLGVIENEVGRYLSAQRHYLSALDLCESIGWRFGVAVCLGYLCNNHFALGDYESAKQFNQRNIVLSRELADQNGLANSLDTGGLIEFMHGYFDLAEKRCAQALELYQEIGARRDEAYALTHLGLIAIQQGDLYSAETYLENAVDYRTESGEFAARIDSMAAIANVHALRGELDKSITIVDTIMAYLDDHGMDGIELPFLVIVTCAEILLDAYWMEPSFNERGRNLLRKGHQELERRANAIDDHEERQRFLVQGPFHQRFQNLFSDQIGTVQG